MRTVLKLGGSVITAKDDPATVDHDALGAACDAVVDRFDASVTPDGSLDLRDHDDLVLVHGGGSFGHPAASAAGVTATEATRDAAAIGEIHAAMTRLSDAVCGALRERGLPAVPVRPLSFATRDREDRPRLHAGSVRVLLSEGFLPVAHGDVVAHRGRGASILSGDALAVGLAQELHADRVGICASTPVRDADGAVVERIDSIEAVRDVIGGSDATDVTGGMAAKVAALVEADRPAAVFDLDDLPVFLDGGLPGTRIGPD